MFKKNWAKFTCDKDNLGKNFRIRRYKRPY